MIRILVLLVPFVIACGCAYDHPATPVPAWSEPRLGMDEDIRLVISHNHDHRVDAAKETMGLEVRLRNGEGSEETRVLLFPWYEVKGAEWRWEAARIDHYRWLIRSPEGPWQQIYEVHAGLDGGSTRIEAHDALVRHADRLNLWVAIPLEIEPTSSDIGSSGAVPEGPKSGPERSGS
ncbi:MAG: hypothetical protein KDB18_14380, partial [Salinibacterium sp.]|nr:hypothetical protein [Salinibacterium sp.]